MKNKYLLVLTILFMQVSLLKADKIITVTVCGPSTYGYNVQERHNYENNTHHLNCTQGGNEPCKWSRNPQVLINNNNLIPFDLIFRDDFGNIMPIDNVALNNALNNQITNGMMSGTLIFDNLFIQYSILPEGGLSDCTNITISISTCCEN
jgi:hypothetical protein